MSNTESDKENGDGGHLSLSWNAPEFVRCVTGALWSLRGADALTDVTLSCSGRTVRAHRVLLAACSPYLRALFHENPCTHPVLIFRDLQFEDLSALVYFMYHGEVSIPQHKLASFLATAKSLQVRGLVEESDISADDPPKDKESNVDECKSPELKRRKISPPVNDSETVEEKEDFPPQNVTENHPVSNPAQQVIELDEDSSSDLSHLSVTNQNDPDDRPPEIIVPLENPNDEINQDEDEVKFRCQLCCKSFKHPISLSLHKDSHTGKTQCPICHRSFSRSYDMRCHITRIHLDQTPEIKIKISKSSIENDT